MLAITGAHVLTALVTACAIDSRRDPQIVAGYVLGLTFGQISLLSTWAVLGPLPGVIRWPGAICGCLLTTLAAIVFFGSDSGPDLLEVVLVLGGTSIILFLSVQTPLWWFRLRYGYRVQLPQEDASLTGIGETQFSLRHLMITTSIIAVLLGVGRVIMGAVPASSWGGRVNWHVFLMFGVLVTFSTGILWLTLVGIFSRLPIAVAGLLLLVLLAPLSWLDAMSLDYVQKQPGNLENLLVIFVLNYTQLAWLCGCLLALRWAGYELRPASIAINAAS